MRGKGLDVNNMTYRGLIKGLTTSGNFVECLRLLDVSGGGSGNNYV